MKKVEMYMANDGKIFETENEAIKYEKHNEVEEKILLLLKDNDIAYDVNRTDICDFIMNNSEALKEILKDL